MSSLVLITPPTVLPVSLAELKAEARLDADDATDDARLAGCLRAAVDRLDGAQGLLGKALIAQEWKLLLPAFSCHNGRIDLPLPPLIEVTEITYVDPAGDAQTLASDRYQVVGIGSHYPGWIAAARATTWPATRCQDEAVTITFRCGFGSDWNAVPEGIRAGLTAMAVAMFDGCDAGDPVAAMLTQYRTRRV
jgi:uncharacterized phiE125 gp8 family phage protein